MLNSFVGLQYHKEGNPSMPTITVSMQRFAGEKLDYRNLSKEDFKALVEKGRHIHFEELNYGTVGDAKFEIYDKAKRIPNLYYVPAGFNTDHLIYVPSMDKKEFTFIEREDLEDNTIVMLCENPDTGLYPAYRNQEGKIEFHNPDLLVVAHYNKVPVDIEEMLKD